MWKKPWGCTRGTPRFCVSFPCRPAWRKWLDQQNKGEGLKGVGLLSIYWKMSFVCMECSSGEKFLGVEGCFWEPLTVSGFIVMGWHLLSPMGLRCAECLSDQTSLLLVSLGEGSEWWSLYENMDPDIRCSWENKKAFTTLIDQCRRGMPPVIRSNTVPQFVKNITLSWR